MIVIGSISLGLFRGFFSWARAYGTGLYLASLAGACVSAHAGYDPARE